MKHPLYIYNTLTREKEQFIPLHKPHVGMYVCGPTVYGDAHLGHARPAITFDLLFRYLKYLGYKVRYVRNITDVGHLEHDADDGEDKIAKKARLEKLEPMEVVEYYTLRYHKAMNILNVLPPSIEPRASGHISEQMDLIKIIIRKGYAYEINGSLYFDVHKYNIKYDYGILSNREIDNALENTRSNLTNQGEKSRNLDFALWKKASPEHIMKWKPNFTIQKQRQYQNILYNNSKNNKERLGFPGWHLECTAMSTKYLGRRFDIHGGGIDLLFPHHECEIAQSTAAFGKNPAKYWMHNNMITINGQKMGKSLGNFITLEEFFTGKNDMLVQAYSPMTIRFYILQAHYRSTVDFSNEALQSSEKGLERLIDAYHALDKIHPVKKRVKSMDKNISVFIKDLRKKCFKALNDDLNSSIVISHLFDAARYINTVKDGKGTITQVDLDELKEVFQLFMFDILGLTDETSAGGDNYESFGKAVDLLLSIRQQAKVNKDWATSDKIRNELTALGFDIKDTKDGAEWKLNR